MNFPGMTSIEFLSIDVVSNGHPSYIIDFFGWHEVCRVFPLWLMLDTT
jgi:hypothetical protein